MTCVHVQFYTFEFRYWFSAVHPSVVVHAATIRMELYETSSYCFMQICVRADFVGFGSFVV